MIKINEDFEAERDNYCWHLHQWFDSKDKDGNPKRSKRTTYHPNLKQVLDAVLDKQAGKCESLDQLINLLANANQLLEGLNDARH